ncbi:uncharacterized protein [Epargyreus clarus]|uniref:uncharacterized protein n=1 Tax=Epargyreus clarus TaxID=520877 RepID=UPI003C3045AA
MADFDRRIVLCVLLLVTYFNKCASIKCYVCNSANNSMCLDPSIYDVDSVSKYLRSVTCERGVLGTGQHANQQMFCRKIVQTIFHKGHDADVRVTRGCGWVKHHRDCYKADNDGHLETVCQCFTDDCNTGTIARYSIAAILIGFSITVTLPISVLNLNIFNNIYKTELSISASIRCYDCNSANNSMCLDPSIYDVDSVAKYLRSVTCHRGIPAAGQKDNQQMFCRKIVQTILHKGHDAEVRVTRGCGWVKHHRDCYKADNEGHLETVCQCFTDDCNTGTIARYSIAAMIIGFSITAIM